MTKKEYIQSHEVISWYNVIPGISLVLYGIEDDHAYVKNYIGNYVSYHRYKVYRDKRGKYLLTKIGKVRLDAFEKF